MTESKVQVRGQERGVNRMNRGAAEALNTYILGADALLPSILSLGRYLFCAVQHVFVLWMNHSARNRP